MSYQDRTKEWEPDPEKSENIFICGAVNAALNANMANIDNLRTWVLSAQNAWRNKHPFVDPAIAAMKEEAAKQFDRLSVMIAGCTTMDELAGAAGQVSSYSSRLQSEQIDGLRSAYKERKEQLS